ncbi:MAG TPA: glycosyltransferase [Pyrinomonadaceae bacterium]|jgi:glycosyltransferase involved in cell wall biosynthesis
MRAARHIAAEESGAQRFDVSLVVPVRNEEASLRALLESIARQTVQPREVILVDGGSTDRTVELARELAANSATPLRVIEATEATPGRGRNIGIEAARSVWVALTDAGIKLEPEWLENLIAVARADSEVSVVYGNYEAAVRSFFERCAALVYLPPKVERGGGRRLRGPSIASALLRREVWRAAGGFPDLRAAEDLFFMEEVARLNFKTGYAPQATVWWNLQPTLRKTFRKFTLYSRHNVWAGRQWDWHYGLARQYAVWLVFVALAFLHSAWWLVVPAAGLLARAFKSIYARREGRGWAWLLNPAQFAGVVFVMLTIDLATFVGWAQAAWRVRPRGDSGAAQLDALKSSTTTTTAAQLDMRERGAEHETR